MMRYLRERERDRTTEAAHGAQGWGSHLKGSSDETGMAKVKKQDCCAGVRQMEGQIQTGY